MGSAWKSNKVVNKNAQKGVGIAGLLVLLATIAVFVTFGISALPMYMDNMTLESIAQDVASEPGSNDMSVRELKATLTQRFETNNLWDMNPEEVIKIKKERGQAPTLQIDYEARRPFLYNIDLVAHFNKEISAH